MGWGVSSPRQRRPASMTTQAMTNSGFMSALTSGFHTESSSMSSSREPSLDTLLLLLLRPARRWGSHWYGARPSRLAFRRWRFCCISSCRRSTLQRVARFSVCRRRSAAEEEEEEEEEEEKEMV